MKVLWRYWLQASDSYQLISSQNFRENDTREIPINNQNALQAELEKMITEVGRRCGVEQ